MGAKKDLQEFIAQGRKGKLSILCVGNELRGDDGLGPEIYRRLEKHISQTILLIDSGNQPENFLSVLTRNKITHCLIIDAVEFHVDPGTVGFFEPVDLKEYQVTFSTHFLGMKMLINTFEEKTNAKFKIVGIQPLNLEFGSTMTQEVRLAIENLVKFLKQLLN